MRWLGNSFVVKRWVPQSYEVIKLSNSLYLALSAANLKPILPEAQKASKPLAGEEDGGPTGRATGPTR